MASGQASLPLRTLSRLAWLVPALLTYLAINQFYVALDIRSTIANGTLTDATITELEISGRTDVTLDYVSLEVPLADGSTLTREEMPIPHSLAPPLEGQETVAVYVLPGAGQEIVIQQIANTQWRIAAINAAVSLLGALLSAWGVFAWNRYLVRKGDPALRTADASTAAN